MKEPERDWRYFIEGLRRGDETITFEFCERYGAGLQRLADRHLITGMRRRLDAEDVVQSVYRTFFRRAADGQFQLLERGSLWRLLCAITLTKVREQARRQLRQKRDLAREVRIDPASGGEGGPADPEDASPQPDASAAFTEQFDKLMASFDEEERSIIEHKLQHRTNEEAAALAGCSERTVRRIVQRVRARLEQILEEDED